MNYALLIEWGNGDNEFRNCLNLKEAKNKMVEYQKYEQVEYLEIVSFESIKGWVNPDCNPED